MAPATKQDILTSFMEREFKHEYKLPLQGIPPPTASYDEHFRLWETANPKMFDIKLDDGQLNEITIKCSVYE